jgi:heme/copper-type cytochrome/quinol oxidase subunit 2
MWGNILTEISFQTNFNLNFSNTKSDVLIHLSQWQYWWWFWFALVWALYYLIIARVLRYRTLKFRPKIVTSFRPHGKWGDLIICILPVSWCLNILINSSFLMKLIEWQNESSLFTIRIRGRQWYWIYRFDLKNFTDILSAPKNIGHNRWQISIFGDLQTSEDYIHILQLRSQNKWIKKYWDDVLDKFKKSGKAHIVSPQEKFKIEFFNKYKANIFTNLCFSLNTNYNFLDINNSLLESKFTDHENHILLNNSVWFKESLNKYNSKFINFNLKNYLNSDLVLNDSYKNFKKTNKFLFNFFEQLSENNQNNNLITHPDLDENSRWVKRSFGKNAPLRIVKYPVSNISDDNLFKLRFNDTESTLKHKNIPNTTYLTLKQKRYKRRKKILLFSKLFKNDSGVKNKFSGKLFLKDNSILMTGADEPTRQYRMMKKNKVRNDLIPIVYSKRLLRVKRTLVIPAHVNITAITNSYDVCHSWFIPGLGLKLDCVPGRATHHTFYVDNVGFYYGQCAEICGRYHHHMPIRVCALPFEHFLVWWHSFGLPKLLFTKNERKYETYYSFRKFVW